VPVGKTRAQINLASDSKTAHHQLSISQLIVVIDIELRDLHRLAFPLALTRGKENVYGFQSKAPFHNLQRRVGNSKKLTVNPLHRH